MDQQTMGWVLLGAAVLILALLIYLLTQVKKSCQNDISTQLQRLQSDLERSVQAVPAVPVAKRKPGPAGAAHPV